MDYGISLFRTKFKLVEKVQGSDTWVEIYEKVWYWPWWDLCCFHQGNRTIPLIFRTMVQARWYVNFRLGRASTAIDHRIEYL